MRVLFFTNNYGTDKKGGGGWVRALESIMVNYPDIDLGVAFFDSGHFSAGDHESVAYFPMRKSPTKFGRFLRFLFSSHQDSYYLGLCMTAVNTFHPDVIHVFGVEDVFGLLATRLKIPVVIHLQGLLNPCLNAWLPPSYSFLDMILNGKKSVWGVLRSVLVYRYNIYGAKREKTIMSAGRFFMGRTAWDNAYCQLYAPQATYYHCDELLRDEFYSPVERLSEKKVVFVSTLSTPLYKGHDMILKTAKILKETGVVDFHWDVFGIDQMKLAERKVGVQAKDVNVKLKGIVSAKLLRESLLSATAYAHPSYIENSPNSVCEAQILGVPVICCNVGGVSSIVSEGETGWLVPANDPYLLAFRLRQILNNPEVAEGIGSQAREKALSRHNKSNIGDVVHSIYLDVIDRDSGTVGDNSSV